MTAPVFNSNRPQLEDRELRSSIDPGRQASESQEARAETSGANYERDEHEGDGMCHLKLN